MIGGLVLQMSLNKGRHALQSFCAGFDRYLAYVIQHATASNINVPLKNKQNISKSTTITLNIAAWGDL